MFDKIKLNTILLILIFAICLTSLITGLSKSESGESAKALFSAAANLYSQGLYEASAEEYLSYLQKANINAERRGNVLYKVGTIYFENLGDYEKAYAYLVKAKMYIDDKDLRREIDLKIVEALERLGRSHEASSRLTSGVSLNEKGSKDNAVLAQIGESFITEADLNKYIDSLPPAEKKSLENPEKKKQYLNSLVLSKALYLKGIRLGYTRNEKVKEDLAKIKEQYIAGKVFEDIMANRLNLSDADIELYYEKNKDEFTTENGKIPPLYAIKNEVREKAAKEKLMREQQKFFQEILQEESIKIFN